MRKTLFITLILLALSAWVVAQQSPNSPPSTSQGATQSAAGGNSVQGCLGGSGNTALVTEARRRLRSAWRPGSSAAMSSSIHC